MGAGGSTAISSSSWDVSQKRQLRQQLEEQHRMQKQRRQQQIAAKAGGLKAKPSNQRVMKQSGSYFDLTTSHLQAQNDHHCRLQTKAAWFDTNHSEAYSLSNANIGPSRPIMVLPSKPVSPGEILKSSGDAGKKSNASRVRAAAAADQKQQYHHRQQLKKFSESLPSLNNLLPHQLINQQQQITKPNNEPMPQHYVRQQQLQRVSNQISAKQQQQQQQQLCHRNEQPSIHLVNRKDESSYRLWSSPNFEQQDRTTNQLIKRAISLSSLHQTQQQQQNMNNSSIFAKQQSNVKRKSHGYNNNSLQQVTNELTTDNYLKTRDLMQLTCTNNIHHMQQQPIQHYNQPTPLAKKILKFKQVSNGSGQAPRRYKQQQQQQPLQQNRCPVLPPLPRSQSLHELIQLRTTENGQRMRTTGTLRGPLGGGEQTCTKVNLVAELLENRRQQKMMTEESSRDSTTLMSQSSSSDDGIHDISINGDQSTGESRSRTSFNNNLLHRHSSASQDNEQLQGSAERQRIYKKNTPNYGAHNGNRFSPKVEMQQSYHKELSHNRTSSIRYCYEANLNCKSTLKRSLSHSALQTSLNNLEAGDNDEDESDDLNELAKFLYQFKQRQAKTKSFSEDMPLSNETDKQQVAHVSSSSSQVAVNPQQSPNSTTSSSGFASSTCTSNSMTSSKSDDGRSRTTEFLKTASAREVDKQDQNAKVVKKQGRKKYPAPARPDASSGSPTKSIEQSSKGRCLIGGKLKLSSSLLSIVDEYNSTLQSKDSLSPQTDTNVLASVLMGESSNSCEFDETPDSSCSQQCQLEKLKRYTQLRQMSQSELALNHLTSSSVDSSSSKGQTGQHNQLGASAKRESGEQRSKPYKSKLINLIKRISDKSEVGSSNSGGRQSITSSSSNMNGGSSSVGGQQALESRKLKTINQSEVIVPNLNQCRQHPLCTRAAGGCLSESLCDLNFDCDFELIKNCGSTGEHRGAVAAGKQQQQQQPQSDGSSLLLLHAAASNKTALMASPLPDADSRKWRQKETAGSKQVANDSSKGENNWRLKPTSLSLVGKVASNCESMKQERQQKQYKQKQSVDEAAKLDSQHNKPVAPTANKLASHAKLKWPASGWLMNSSSKNKQLKQQEAADKAAAAASGLIAEAGMVGKNGLGKLISNSRIPLSVAPVSNTCNTANVCSKNVDKDGESIESTNYAKVNSEANRLLDELDHSLDLVSANCTPFSRKAALSWWNDDSVCLSNSKRFGMDKLVHESTDLLSDSQEDCNDYDDADDDDDDDDACDYANINRAMINATLGVDLMHERDTGREENLHSQAEPSSPSDSFTFSASSSPVAAPILNAKPTLLSANSKLYQTKESKSNIEGAEHWHEEGVKIKSKEHLLVQSEKAAATKQSNGIRKFTSTDNHVISLNSSTCDTSHEIHSQDAAKSAKVSCSPGRKDMLAMDGNNLDRKRIAISQCDRDVERGLEDGCKMMVVGKKTGSAPIATIKNAGCCIDNNKQLTSRGDRTDQVDTGESQRNHCMKAERNGKCLVLDNNLDRCCEPSCSAVLDDSIVEQQTNSVSGKTAIGDNDIPCKLNSKSNGTHLKCHSTTDIGNGMSLNCQQNGNQFSCLLDRKPANGCQKQCEGSKLRNTSVCHFQHQSKEIGVKWCGTEELSAAQQQQQQQQSADHHFCPSSIQGQQLTGQSTCCCSAKEGRHPPPKDIDKLMSLDCHKQVKCRQSNNDKSAQLEKTNCCPSNKCSSSAKSKSAQGENFQSFHCETKNLHDNGGATFSRTIVNDFPVVENNKLIIEERSCHCLSTTTTTTNATSEPLVCGFSNCKTGIADTKNSQDSASSRSPPTKSHQLHHHSHSPLSSSRPSNASPSSNSALSSSFASAANVESKTTSACYSKQQLKFSPAMHSRLVDKLVGCSDGRQQEVEHNNKHQQSSCNRLVANNCFVAGQETADARCKVVACCHHPSSLASCKLSNTNHNEDIKSQSCVSRDNLILKTGQEDESEQIMNKGLASGVINNTHRLSDNCPCCCQQSVGIMSTSSSHYTQNCSPFERDERHNNKQFDANARFSFNSNNHPENVNLRAPGAKGCPMPAHMINNQLQIKSQPNNLICRSNSELVSVSPKKGSQLVNAVTGNRQKEQILFGKLRNSLLNKKEARAPQLNKASKLATSQLCLLNQYKGANFVSPFIAPHLQADYHSTNSTSSSNQLNVDFDDNFILKRKTPNAGLKTRC